MTPLMPEYLQTVTLVLSDGRRVQFSGRHQIADSVQVVEIIVGPARELPSGMCFETLPPQQEDAR